MEHYEGGIGTRLMALRNDKKETQAEFADRLGIPRSSYKNYETGIRPVPFSLIQTLVIEEGVDARWLIAGRTELLNAQDNQLIKDCMMLRSVMDRKLAEKNMTLTDDQKGDIIMLLVEKRSGEVETAPYDRDLLCQLMRSFFNAPRKTVARALR